MKRRDFLINLITIFLVICWLIILSWVYPLADSYSIFRYSLTYITFTFIGIIVVCLAIDSFLNYRSRRKVFGRHIISQNAKASSISITAASHPMKQRLVKRIVNKIPLYFFSLLTLIFFVGWFLVPFYFSRLHPNPTSIQLPIAMPGDITVDNQGKIYCFLRIYKRIQIYSPNGKFLRGSFIKVAGECRLGVQEDGSIRLAKSANRHIIFDTNGNLLDEIEVGRAEHVKFWDKTKNEHRDSAGNIYKVVDKWHSPKVVQISPTGEQSVLISNSFRQWFLMMAQLPSYILLCVAAGILMGVTLRITKRKQSTSRRHSL